MSFPVSRIHPLVVQKVTGCEHLGEELTSSLVASCVPEGTRWRTGATVEATDRVGTESKVLTLVPSQSCTRYHSLTPAATALQPLPTGPGPDTDHDDDE